MIYKDLTTNEFIRAFNEIRPNSFSRLALRALYHYLEERNDEQGTFYYLDVVCICCDFSEYVDFADVQSNYKALDIEDLEELRAKTLVIEFDNGLLIQNF